MGVKRISSSTGRPVKIWVRKDEENNAEFVYRATQNGDVKPTCYDAEATIASRAGWNIIGKEDLSLPACAAMQGPKSPGTFYSLERVK